MIVYYRISNNSYSKPKFENASKISCLINFTKNVLDIDKDIFLLYADNINEATFNLIKEYNPVKISEGNAGSFRRVLRDALILPDNEIVLFQEDDYLYLPSSRNCILEGLEIADYVSLYDHPDKYIAANKGGNPFIEDDGGEKTKVYLTKSTHWKLANSTTMTFATKVKTLREDKPVWDKYISGNHPYDFQAFCELIQNKGRKLVTPIPAKSTHAEIASCSPLIKWENV